MLRMTHRCGETLLAHQYGESLWARASCRRRAGVVLAAATLALSAVVGSASADPAVTADGAGLAAGAIAAAGVGPGTTAFEQSPALPEEEAPQEPDLQSVLAQEGFDRRTRLELEILERVNAVRAEHGLPALRLDDRLVAAARQHAVDMAYRNHCHHIGTDGSRVRDRIQRNGYSHSNWVGENILCSRQTADAAMSWWLGSTPHRRNILHSHYTHIGVGASMLGRYGPDMVLVFAAGDSRTAEPGVFRSFRLGQTSEWVAATGEPDSVPR